MARTKPIYAYFGHHKSASTWFESICESVCRDLKLKYVILYRSKHFDYDLKAYLEKHSDVDFIAYANADYQYIKPIENLKGVHVVRDPRDIVVSAYFSHLYSHPTHTWTELVAYREKIQNCDQDEGLMHELDFRKEQFDEMRSWKEPHDHIIDLKMEDITPQPYKEMLKFFDYLGLLDSGEYTAKKRTIYFINKLFRRLEYWLKIPLPNTLKKIPAERLLGIIWENDFQKKAGGRKAGEEDKKSHYRKGVAGDWRNHFKQQHIDYLKQQYNDVLVQYGYEADDNWS